MSSYSKREIAESLALLNVICYKCGYSFDDMYYLSDPKMMNISVSLIMEIRDLKDKGYTYEEIFDLVQSMDLSQDNLTEDEYSFIKRDAVKNLKIIYKKER